MKHVWRQVRSRSFTLVELLVVVAIIGILAAMLLPAVASARERGRRVKCASNIHQIILALKMYAMDNDEKFPGVASATFGGPNGALNSYVDSPALFVCPSDGIRSPAASMTAMAETNCSYLLVYNDWASVRGSSRPMSEATPSRYFHVLDKNGNSGSGPVGRVNATSFGGNHASAGGNVGRVDGSVEWITTAQWLRDPTGSAGTTNTINWDQVFTTAGY